MFATLDRRKVRQWTRYDDMQTINHRWIKEIPSHWSKKRISWLFDLLGSGTTPSTSERKFYEGGSIPWVNTGDLNDGFVIATEKCVNETAIREHSALKLYPAGTLLIALYGATIGKLGLLSTASTVNQACFAMGAPKPDVSPRYVLYWLLGNREHIVSMAYGGGQPNISGELVRSLRIMVPPLPEQRAIAAFLDRETARIDALIARKQRLIELLEEKRQATISITINRGLNPKVATKDSGSEFWGQIPKSWSLTKLRYYVPDDRQIMYGIVLPGPHVQGGIPIVKGGNCEPGKLKLELLSCTSKEIESAYEKSRLRAGDIVYSIRGSIGAAQIVPESIAGANITQDAARVSPKPGTNVRWLLYALQSSQFYAKLDAGALGATIRGINIRDLKRAEIPLLHESEQTAIADFLDARMARLDKLVEVVKATIVSLLEYRAAIISAAVTGQIDVREEVRIDG